MITSGFLVYLYFTVYPSSFYYMGLNILLSLSLHKCQYVHVCLCTHVQTLAHLWVVEFSLSTVWILGIKFRLSGLNSPFTC